MEKKLWTAKVTERMQDVDYPDDTSTVGAYCDFALHLPHYFCSGNWDLNEEGEHRWKHAEERRRFFI